MSPVHTPPSFGATKPPANRIDPTGMGVRGRVLPTAQPVEAVHGYSPNSPEGRALAAATYADAVHGVVTEEVEPTPQMFEVQPDGSVIEVEQ